MVYGINISKNKRLYFSLNQGSRKQTEGVVIIGEEGALKQRQVAASTEWKFQDNSNVVKTNC